MSEKAFVLQSSRWLEIATPAGWSVRMSISKVPNLAPSSASEEAQSDGQRTSRVLIRIGFGAAPRLTCVRREQTAGAKLRA
ncbi:hypothetical protein [Bradyrhizobium sp. th.b2]|uniref:hypothetical protein n=1 Tax=Bradyrhizobium sp. th-b2 TaxID=172088 RepID=UPI0012EC3E9D|nr:hypothetical protein [Bradyrhizobium sp. th.b2]